MASSSEGESKERRLIADIESPDWLVRRNAASELWKCKSPRAVAALTKALGDPDEGVRVTAARALGKAGDPVAVPALAHSLRYDPAARKNAARALAQTATQDSLPLIVELLDDPEDETRDATAQVLQTLGGDRTAALLMEALQSKSPYLRQGAADTLGRLASKDAVQPLTKLLFDPVAGVRSAAASSLGKVKAKETASALLALLNDKDGEVRKCTIAALGAIRSEEAVPRLIEMVKSGGVDWVSAVSALAEVSTPEAKAVLLEVLHKSNNVEEKRAVAWALRSARGEDVARALLTAADDRDVGRTAVDAVLELPDIDTVKPYLERLKGGSEAERYLLDWLEDVNDPAVVPIISEFVEDPNEDVRKAVAEILDRVVPERFTMDDDGIITVRGGPIRRCSGYTIIWARITSRDAPGMGFSAVEDDGREWGRKVPGARISEHARNAICQGATRAYAEAAFGGGLHFELIAGIVVYATQDILREAGATAVQGWLKRLR